MKFQVRVPATSANMEPGFDCLGIALELFNVFIVEEASSFSIEIRGEGQNILPRSTGNPEALLAERDRKHREAAAKRKEVNKYTDNLTKINAGSNILA